MGYDYYGFAPYVSVEELKARAALLVKKESLNGNILNPVILESRVIAKNWWGKTWISNLESYADYKTRLERGRRYVRANCVVDLRIKGGLVEALVLGSQKKPYSVGIKIDMLDEEKYESIALHCSNKIQNLESLVNGTFPEDLKNLFSNKNGIFPTMSEIHFGCSCPDWADMCKHVAAVLYAIGAKFDKEPLLFFTLRGIDVQKLVGGAIQNKLNLMLQNADKKTSRIISDESMTKLFGL